MLLTTEVVDTPEMAATILRWYTYRWRVEEYHKIFKSGCQSERYRLAAVGMKTMLGFLSIATAKAVRTLASRCAQSHHVKNQTDRDIYESDFLTMTNIAQSC